MECGCASAYDDDDEDFIIRPEAWRWQDPEPEEVVRVVRGSLVVSGRLMPLPSSSRDRSSPPRQRPIREASPPPRGQERRASSSLPPPASRAGARSSSSPSRGWASSSSVTSASTSVSPPRRHRAADGPAATPPPPRTAFLRSAASPPPSAARLSSPSSAASVVSAAPRRAAADLHDASAAATALLERLPLSDADASALLTALFWAGGPADPLGEGVATAAAAAASDPATIGGGGSSAWACATPRALRLWFERDELTAQLSRLCAVGTVAPPPTAVAPPYGGQLRRHFDAGALDDTAALRTRARALHSGTQNDTSSVRHAHAPRSWASACAP